MIADTLFDSTFVSDTALGDTLVDSTFVSDTALGDSLVDRAVASNTALVVPVAAPDDILTDLVVSNGHKYQMIQQTNMAITTAIPI